MTKVAKPKIGRPRSEVSQEAILRATHELLNEKGAAGMSVEAIAKRAKVGKTTIYRWWPSMADIVLELVLDDAKKKIAIPVAGTFEENLKEFLRQSMKAVRQWGGVHLRFLMAHAQKDEAFRERFRENFIMQRRGVHKDMLRQSKFAESVSDQKIKFLMDMIFGAMWYRLLIGHAVMDEDFADELAVMAAGYLKNI